MKEQSVNTKGGNRDLNDELAKRESGPIREIAVGVDKRIKESESLNKTEDDFIRQQIKYQLDK
jgi:hypothetical protein